MPTFNLKCIFIYISCDERSQAYQLRITEHGFNVRCLTEDHSTCWETIQLMSINCKTHLKQHILTGNRSSMGATQTGQTLAVQSVQPLLDCIWSLRYALHPHHWPIRWSTPQRMPCAEEDFYKKILSLATGGPCTCNLNPAIASEVNIALLTDY